MRITDKDGNKLNFTCQNSKYKTDINKGLEHEKGGSKGSVTSEALFKSEGYSLWLEYVVNVHDEDEQCYWFMYYKDGLPIMPMSAVIDEETITKVINNISNISLPTGK
jgi:hypothetical protein